jgi:flagellar motor switch protein FliM
MSVLPNIQSLFGGGSISLDRVPMLRVVFERAAAASAKEFRTSAGNQLLLSVAGLQTGTAGEVLAQHDGAIVAAALHASAWNARLLISARRSAVFAIVEMMLGGDGSQPAYAGKRPFSKAETRLAATFFERFAKALAAAVAQVAPTPFTLEAPANSINFEAVGNAVTPVFAVKLNLEALGRGGEIVVAVPQSAIVPLRNVFAQTGKDSNLPDPRWTEQIEREIKRANVTLNAVLDERTMRLGEIGSLRVGQVLELKATSRSRVHLECDGERMIACQFGRSNGVYTLRVDDFVDREREFMDDILAR